jgi:hypothetical protein
MGVSRDTVDRLARELVSGGFVLVEQRFDEAGDATTNRWVLLAGGGSTGSRKSAAGVAANLRGPSRTDAGTGGRKSAATGGRKSAAQNESQMEREPEGRKTTALASADTFDGEVVALANLLADLIEGNGSKRPVVTKAWFTTIDRMIRLDDRSPDQIERAIRWCQQDDFWHRNILSPDKLRKHYDRLRLAAKEQRRVPKGMSAAQEFLERLQGDSG